MMIYYKPGFRKIIKKEREKRNWSYVDFENATGISKKALSKIENGKEDPVKSTLDRIEKALGGISLYCIDYDGDDKEMKTKPGNHNRIREKETESER